MDYLKKLLRHKHGDREESPSNSPDSSPSHSSSSKPSPSNSSSSPRTQRVGVRPSSNKHVAEVLPKLYLGSQEFAQDLHALQKYKITHILNITVEVDNAFPTQFQYMQIPVQDRPSTQLGPYLDEAFHFIQDGRAQGSVLVHCYYGASRSASIVIGYLMRTERMRYREALEYLQLLRPEVYPNDGFTKQLKDYEVEAHSR